MKENEIQQTVLNFLEKKFKSSKISSEFPLIHGTADISMEWKNNIYLFELKEKPNSRLFEQALRHFKYADYVICISSMPFKEKTKIKWENRAIDNNINMLWIETLKKKQIKKAIKNQELNKKLRRITYGI